MRVMIRIVAAILVAIPIFVCFALVLAVSTLRAAANVRRERMLNAMSERPDFAPHRLPLYRDRS
jgi:hypothetical protein